MSFESFSTADEAAELRRIVAEFTELQSRIDELEARQTEVLAAAMGLAAIQIERMPSQTSRDHEMPVRTTAAELATAVRASDRAIQSRMATAADLVTRFPATVAAWKAGRVSRGHARVIAEAGGPIEDPVARAAFEEAALSRAATLTPGRLAPAAARLAEEYRPTTLTERHAAARAERRIAVTDVGDGMAELWMLLPAVLAHGILDRVTRGAREVITARTGSRSADRAPDRAAETEAGAAEADTRTLDQVRVDLIADLLLTAAPTLDTPTGLAAIHATVEVTVPALTLLGAGEGGATLTGRSPIDAGTARRLAGGCAGWDRVLTHPVTGAVLAVDRYTPSADLRRFLRARDEHCRFPGCRMRAARCDIDHTEDAARGGETRLGNTAHLCRRHHTLKHHGGWAVRQHSGGVLEWTSPTGRRYTDRPPATVRFAPAPEPEPVG